MRILPSLQGSVHILQATHTSSFGAGKGKMMLCSVHSKHDAITYNLLSTHAGEHERPLGQKIGGLLIASSRGSEIGPIMEATGTARPLACMNSTNVAT